MLCLLFSRTDGSGLTQFSSLFLLFSFGGKKTAQKPELLFPLCHSWLPINLNWQYSDDSTWCPAARYDWVTFFSSVSYQKKKKKISLYWGLSAHDCTTVINQTWQQWLHLYRSETGIFHNQNHPVSVRSSSPVKFFLHVFFFLFLIKVRKYLRRVDHI